MSAAKPKAWIGAEGVIYHSKVPHKIAPTPPPTKPSTVLEGLIAGAIEVFPNSLPKTYC
jgi:hypothetical protein